MILAKFEDVYKRIQPGDVIAVGGTSNRANIIKTATKSKVSHVACVVKKQKTDSPLHTQIHILESTSHNDNTGVCYTALDKQHAYFMGELWWLPLSDEARLHFDEDAFYDFLFQQLDAHKPYDLRQAVTSAIDWRDKKHGIGYNKEDFSKFFCSELVAAGLEASGITGQLNASEVTPVDLCCWNIYQDDYYLLSGNPETRIDRFNTVSPSQWNL